MSPTDRLTRVHSQAVGGAPSGPLRRLRSFLVWTALAVVGFFALLDPVGTASWSAGLCLAVSLLAATLALASGAHLFHPQVLPTAYVAVATALPAIVAFDNDSTDLGTFWGLPLHPSTPTLMALSGLTFAAGTTLGSERRRSASRRVLSDSVSASRSTVGRTTTSAGILLLLLYWMRSSQLAYGEGQTDYGLVALVLVAGNALILSGLVLTLGSRRSLNIPIRSRPLDLVLAGAAVAMSLANGVRGIPVALTLLVLMMLPLSRKALSLLLAAAVVAALPASMLVADWRNGGDSGTGRNTFFAQAVYDLSSTMATTGITASSLGTSDFTHGSTLLAGTVRLLPSPLAVAMLGEPDDTGNAVFRELTGFDNPDVGYAFSLPAEGFLNGGVFGLAFIMLSWGFLFRWFWSRYDCLDSASVSLVYPVAVATMPIALRSDFLGAVKIVAYAWLLIACLGSVARHVASSRVDARRLQCTSDLKASSRWPLSDLRP